MEPTPPSNNPPPRPSPARGEGAIGGYVATSHNRFDATRLPRPWLAGAHLGRLVPLHQARRARYEPGDIGVLASDSGGRHARADLCGAPADALPGRDASAPAAIPGAGHSGKPRPLGRHCLWCTVDQQGAGQHPERHHTAVDRGVRLLGDTGRAAKRAQLSRRRDRLRGNRNLDRSGPHRQTRASQHHRDGGRRGSGVQVRRLGTGFATTAARRQPTTGGLLAADAHGPIGLCGRLADDRHHPPALTVARRHELPRGRRLGHRLSSLLLHDEHARRHPGDDGNFSGSGHRGLLGGDPPSRGDHDPDPCRHGRDPAGSLPDEPAAQAEGTGADPRPWRCVKSHLPGVEFRVDMRRPALVLTALALTLGACTMPTTGASGSPTPTATPTPTPSATPTPAPSPTLVGGRIIVSNLDDNGAAVVAGILYPPSGGSCVANGKYDSCPVTDGLAAQLDSNPLKQAEPLCRCQNTYQSRTITTEALPPGNPGAIAHVVLDFGGSTVKLDVTVIRSAGGWFASDTSCTGQDSGTTSIYAAMPPACGP